MPLNRLAPGSQAIILNYLKLWIYQGDARLMSAEAHKDPAKSWLTFFFVCFASSVLAIGVWACFNYKVDAPEAAVSAGHH